MQSGPLGKVAVAYMQWASSNDQDVVLNWSLIDGAESAQAIADKLGEAAFRRAQRTSISGGIDFAAHMFENNGYNGAAPHHRRLRRRAEQQRTPRYRRA